MIKIDKGQLMVQGDCSTIMAEFTIISKMILSEFGEENFAEAIALAITTDPLECPTRVDVTMLNDLLNKLKEDGEL